MISIRRLFVLISILYSAVMAAGFVAVHLGWLYPEKVQNVLERQQSEQDSIHRQLDDTRREVLVRARDYSTRSDIVEYLETGNKNAISAIFTAEQFKLLDLNGAVFLPAEEQGRIQSYHFQDGIVEANNPRLADWATRQQWLQCSQVSQHSASSGYTLFDNRPYITSSSQVVDASGQSLGQLILMRQVNDLMVQKVARSTDSSLQLIPLNSALRSLDAPLQQPLANIQACQSCPNGKPVFCLETTPRVSPPVFAEPEGVATVISFSLLPLLVSLMALGLLIEPIRKATRLLERHHEEGVIEPIKMESPVRILEFEQLGEAYNAVAAKVSEQRVYLEAMSNTDRLTNIPNRRAFDLAVKEAWNRVLRRPGHCIALVMVDIDYFKEYNDSFGHQAGDEVLIRVAQALQKCSQRADELVARYGGEEFALIIYVEDALELDRYRQRLREVIAELDIDHPTSPHGGKLTVSAGMSWINQSGSWLNEFSSDYWVELADVALYQTKLMGRNNSLLQVMHKDMKKENHNTFEDLQSMKAELKDQLEQSRRR